MDCSWSTLCIPGNLLHALWDLTVLCWRNLRICCIRLRSTEVAPTEERIVAFQAQSPPNANLLQRQLSLQARQGSVSSVHDSTLSEFSPSNEAFSVPESVSETSPNSGLSPSSEQAERDPGIGQGGREQDDILPGIAEAAVDSRRHLKVRVILEGTKKLPRWPGREIPPSGNH